MGWHALLPPPPPSHNWDPPHRPACPPSAAAERGRGEKIRRIGRSSFECNLCYNVITHFVTLLLVVEKSWWRKSVHHGEYQQNATCVITHFVTLQFWGSTRVVDSALWFERSLSQERRKCLHQLLHVGWLVGIAISEICKHYWPTHWPG